MAGKRVEHDGEILKEEKKHVTPGARKDHEAIIQFFRNWFLALSRTSIKTSDALVLHDSPNHKLDSIEDLLRHGRVRINTVVLPGYDKYTKKVQRESTAVQEDAEGYRTYLNSYFTVDMLKCAASLSPRGLSQADEMQLDNLVLGQGKSYWVEFVSRLYCRRDVNEIMIRNNISSKTAEDFLKSVT